MNAHATTGWSETSVEVLKVLWGDGKSAGAIAKLLGVTRCAVSGKVHRLGLQKRLPGKASNAVLKPAPTVDPTPNRDPTRYQRAFSPLPNTTPVTLLDVAAHQCRWPVGDLICCGVDKSSGSYCRHHATLAYER